MKEDIKRIMKGYKPKSENFWLWAFYDLVIFLRLIKFLIVDRIKRIKKENI